jgi:hypothetical protein
MSEGWMKTRSQKRKRVEKRRGQCDKYCCRVKNDSRDTFSKHLNLEDVQVLFMKFTCSNIPVVEALRLCFPSVYSCYKCPAVWSSALCNGLVLFRGEHSAYGCTYRENKKHIKILCGTDHFRNLGIYEGRIIKLILEGGREKQIS